MKFINKIQNLYSRLIAKQLRRPNGILAKFVGNSMNKVNETIYHLTLNNLDLKDGEMILEIGFGNGYFFPLLDSLANHLSISGIDYSSEMVKEAIKNNKNLYESGIMKLSVGNSDNMPFETNSFDKIFCINVIYFWENPELHLKEIFRVLKPGGYFCAGFRPKENLSKFPFSKFGFTLYTETDWRNLIEENGFEFIKSQNGKEFEMKSTQKGNVFESICIVCTKR